MNPAFLLMLLAGTATAAPPLTGFPFTDESLTYKIGGPSGIGLGEAHVSAKRGAQGGAAGWEFELKADMGIPGFAIKDVYSSRTNSDFCSTAFNRQFEHGSDGEAHPPTIDVVSRCWPPGNTPVSHCSRPGVSPRFLRAFAPAENTRSGRSGPHSRNCPSIRS